MHSLLGSLSHSFISYIYAGHTMMLQKRACCRGHAVCSGMVKHACMITLPSVVTAVSNRHLLYCPWVMLLYLGCLVRLHILIPCKYPPIDREPSAHGFTPCLLLLLLLCCRCAAPAALLTIRYAHYTPSAEHCCSFTLYMITHVALGPNALALLLLPLLFTRQGSCGFT